MKNKRTKASKASAAAADRKSRRNVIVIASLLGSLVLTSALLLGLATEPIVPGSNRSLLAQDVAQDGTGAVFSTRQGIANGRWQYIYIRHSRTAEGNATSLAREAGGMPDHFLIGNGRGTADGEIQIGYRWEQQLPALLGTSIDNQCISICLVGDFDRHQPTDAQVQQVHRLVTDLQRRLGIPGERVLVWDRAGSDVGVGQHFPAASFTQALLN